MLNGKIKDRQNQRRLLLWQNTIITEATAQCTQCELKSLLRPANWTQLLSTCCVYLLHTRHGDQTKPSSAHAIDPTINGRLCAIESACVSACLRLWMWS